MEEIKRSTENVLSWRCLGNVGSAIVYTRRNFEIRSALEIEIWEPTVYQWS